MIQIEYDLFCYASKRSGMAFERSRVHSRPADRRLAPPAQALCDLVYTSRNRGLDPRSLYTFRKLEQLPIPPDLLARYPNTVQRHVGMLLEHART